MSSLRTCASGVLASLLAAACERAAPPAPPPPPAAAPSAAEVAGSVARKPSTWRFEARIELALPGKPEHVAIADLDGDGRDELIAVAREPGALAIWRGEPDGLAREARSSKVDPWPLEPLVLARGAFGAPADQRPIAIASRATRRIAIVDPSTGATVRAFELASAPRAAAHGELDGRAAIVAALDDRTLVRCDADGVAMLATLEGELPRCVAIASDGSGVLVGAQDTADVAFHRRSADRGVERSASFRLALDGFPRALIEADTDGDGDLELAIVGGAHHLWIYGEQRAGGPSAWRATDGRAPRELETAAVPIDVVDLRPRDPRRGAIGVLAFADLTLAIAPVESSGLLDALSTRAAQTYAGQTPTSLAAGDFDGDGAIDLAIPNRDASAISVIELDGERRPRVARNAAVGSFPVAVACADLDGDGDDEAIALAAKSDELAWVDWRDGAPIAVARIESGPAPRALAIADVDGDGNRDAAWISAHDANAFVEIAFGDGKLALARRANAASFAFGRATEQLLAADLDRDGAVELLGADPESATLWLAAGARAGSTPFEPPIALAQDGSPRALLEVELDGDQGPELAVALDGSSGRAGLALLDLARAADGAWSARELGFHALRGAPWHLARISVDADARTATLAILALDGVDATGGRIEIVDLRAKPDGAIAIEPVASSTQAGLRPRRLAAADLDGDGRAELFAAAQNTHAVHAWSWIAGDRARSLDALPALGAGLGCLDVALGDLDGDDVLDLLVANAFSDDVSVLRGAR